MLGPLLEIEMSKKCMPLWLEAHVQAKMDSLLVFGRINSRGGEGGCHPRDGLLGTWPSHRTEQFKPRVPPPPHQERYVLQRGWVITAPYEGIVVVDYVILSSGHPDRESLA